jgi:hypothetical protein
MTTRVTRIAEALPGDASSNTGAIRVGINAAVTAVAVFVVGRFTDQTVDVTHPLFIFGTGAVVGFGYRLSRYLAHRFPKLAWILFGTGTEPTYE